MRLVILLVAVCIPWQSAVAQKEYGFDNRKSSGQPYLSPAETVKRMKVPAGFSVKLFAAEPLMTNPIAMTIDEKGRVWIIESYEYPKRTPPGQAPRDRIVILEDTDGDGVADKRTVFAEGKDFPVTPERAARGLGAFDMASGLEVGAGGCFVGAPPYLWYLKDTKGTGHADKFEIVASGFGSQDTHETLNTFTWGPNDCLYGLHGVFTVSKVKGTAGAKQPGADAGPGELSGEPIDLDAGVWRYDPGKKKFDIFAEGTSNPWGMDFNRQGECIICACVIPHLYHMVPGGIYIKQGGKPSFNQYVYGPLKEICDHTFHKESGWAHAGLLSLDAPHMPEEYQKSVIFGSIHGCSLKRNTLKPHGSTFTASRADDFLVSGDKNFRPIQLRWAPDGSILVSDWHDQNPCHQTKPDDWDYERGRIYRIVPPTTIDPAKKEDNPFWRKVYTRESNGLSVKHMDAETRRAMLIRLAAEQTADNLDYDKIWTYDIQQETSLRLLREYASGLLRAAATSKNVLSPFQALCKHDELLNDPVIPQLLWLTFEKVITRDRQSAMQWLQSAGLRFPVVTKHLLPRTLRRLAATGNLEDLHAALQFISQCTDPAICKVALGGLAQALEGRQIKDVPAWRAVSSALQKLNDPDINRLHRQISASFYDSDAVAESLKSLRNEATSTQERIDAIRYLALLREKQALNELIVILQGQAVEPLKISAAQGLASFDQAEIAGKIIASWKQFSPTLRAELVTTLRSRRTWAKALLEALGEKRILRSDLNDNVALAIRQFKDKDLNALLDKHYGTFRDSPAEIDALMTKLTKEVPLAPGDIKAGKAVFTKHCLQCHKFEGQGFDVGPVLDGAERTKDYLLANIIDPNRVVGTPYFTRTVVMKNGKLITGILVEEDATTLRLKRENAIIEVIVKADIEEQSTSTKSLMPEGLTNNMTVQDLRDLIRYLEAPSKPPAK